MVMNVYFIIYYLLFYVSNMTDSISNRFVGPCMDWQKANKEYEYEYYYKYKQTFRDFRDANVSVKSVDLISVL
jgi:hypothetical protein